MLAPNLKLIDLQYNAMTEVSSTAFSYLTLLEGIIMTFNKVTRLDKGAFTEQVNVNTLFMSQNQLREIDPSVFAHTTRMRDLRLDNNELTELTADIFASMSLLDTLWLQGNRLKALPDGMFAKQTMLRELSLYNNYITAVGRNAILSPSLSTAPLGGVGGVGVTGTGTGTLEVIDMSGNPSQCTIGFDGLTGKQKAGCVCALGLFGNMDCAVRRCPVEIVGREMESTHNLRSGPCRNNKVGEHCQVDCKLGYNGGATFTCGFDGNWHPSDTGRCSNIISPVVMVTLGKNVTVPVPLGATSVSPQDGELDTPICVVSNLYFQPRSGAVTVYFGRQDIAFCETAFTFWYSLGRWSVKVVLEDDPNNYFLIDFRLPPQKFDQANTVVYRDDVFVTSGVTEVSIQLSLPRMLVGRDLFDLRYKVDPKLPAVEGLGVDAETGMLTGKPVPPGSKRVKIICIDLESSESVTVADFIVHIAPPLHNKFVTVLRKNQKFTGPKVQVFGGAAPVVFFCQGCSLPAGIVLSPQTGQLSGTPTHTGIFSDIQVIGVDNNNAQISLSPQMMIVRSEILLVHDKLRQGLSLSLHVDMALSWNYTLRADQADVQPSFKAMGLPDGLVVVASTGTITGVPTESGVFTPSLIVTDEVTGAESVINAKPFKLVVHDCKDEHGSCTNGGSCVDTVPFDGRFECACPEGFATNPATARAAAGVNARAAAADADADAGQAQQQQAQQAQQALQQQQQQQQAECVAVQASGSDKAGPTSPYVLTILIVLITLAAAGAACYGAALVYASRKQARPTVYTYDDEMALVQELIQTNTTAKSKALTADLLPDLVRPRTIDSKKLVVHELICATETRQVYKAQLTLCGVFTTVAVKCNRPENLDPDANFQLQTEATLLAQFNHPNILGLVGCSMVGPRAMLLMEHCIFGSLLGLLRETACREELERQPAGGGVRRSSASARSSSRSSGESLQNGLMFACQIANGMAYLHSKMYGHYNLSASSVFVVSTIEGSICKIAKFGVPPDLASRHQLKRFARKNNEQSVRWKSVEWALHNSCTPSADVWSFGVLLYEVFTLGAVPYADKTDTQVLEALVVGERLPCPAAVSIALFDAVMAPCWTSANERIGFRDLVVCLRGARLDHLQNISRTR